MINRISGFTVFCFHMDIIKDFRICFNTFILPVCVKCLLAFYCNFQISYIAWNILVDVEPYFNATGYTSPVIIRLAIPQRAHLFHGPLDNEPLAICFSAAVAANA